MRDFLNGHIFVYYRPFKQRFKQKNVKSSGIRTLIIGTEVKHADHLTSPRHIKVFFESQSQLKIDDKINTFTVATK